MTQFSEAAWQRTAGLRAAIDALPFNTELTAGTLSRDAPPERSNPDNRPRTMSPHPVIRSAATGTPLTSPTYSTAWPVAASSRYSAIM